jgi:type IV pilus assembly protein PilW
MNGASQRGYNLIEMMVGLAIGLIGMLAVAQIFVTFNQQRNTATQLMEAQSNGAMALYLLERDIAQAGYGLMSLQSCSDANTALDSDGDGATDNDQDLNWYYNPPGCSSTCGVQPVPLSTKPVRIVVGGSGARGDSLVVRYARADTGAPGSAVLSAQDPDAAADYKLTSTAGFSQEDLAAVNVGGSCTLFQVTNVDPTNRTLSHGTNYNIMVGGVTESRTSSYNPGSADPNGTDPGWERATENNVVVNLGRLVDRTYSLSASDALQMQGFQDDGATPLVENIVYLKAQYGLNTAGGGSDKSVDLWSTDLTPISSGSQVDYSRIVALRVGIVARSPLTERQEVDAPNRLTVLPEITDGAGTTLGSAVTYDVPDRHYRYKVYYTIIPLRNVIWGS